MFEKRPKLSFFILGMFFGALCGGILVYYNSVITNENKISVNLIPQIVKQVIGVINNKSDAKNDTTASSITPDANLETTNALTAIDDDNSSEQINELTLVNDEDSLMTDSTQLKLNDETINIKKEELLLAKEMIVYPLESYIKSNKSDSLLAIVSGTKDESKRANQQRILVELWKSPINYRGYQASKNKIIAYGLNEIDNIKLFSYKNYMLLKYNETVYYIEFSNEFSSYEKVADVNLLSQINKINP